MDKKRGSMHKLIKNEMIKIFSNRQIYFAVAIGVVLTIILTYMQVKDRDAYEEMSRIYGAKGDLYYPKTIYNAFIGLDYIYLPSVILYTIFPILATLPFAASYANEKRSGYVKNILVKVDKRKYYISKFASVFFSAFITVLMVLILSLIITMLFFPILKPELVTATYTISSVEQMWFDLFATHPMIYILAYIHLDALYYAAITVVTLVISMITQNKFIVYTGTMLLCMAVDYVSKIAYRFNCSPTVFLRPAQFVEGVNFSYILISFSLIVCVCGFLFIKVEGGKDTL